MNHAIDSLRQAPNAAKRPRLEALRQLPCTQKLQCDAKRLCSSAYAAHVAALAELDAAQQQLDNTPGSELAAKLERIRSQLVTAEKATQACVHSQAELQQQYGLGR